MNTTNHDLDVMAGVNAAVVIKAAGLFEAAGVEKGDGRRMADGRPPTSAFRLSVSAVGFATAFFAMRGG
jgi:hypothetical protein